jgi:hypothetical protein
VRAPLSTATRQHLELEISFFAVTVLSAVYVAYDLLAEPRGGHPFGNWLGIIGTLLMILTETGYSLRKRTRLLHWAGPVRRWLSFHIVTGIVGPFLVLMHTGLQFRGLAGFTMLLTVLVVVSGFIGRYLYSGLQRARQGDEGELQLLANGLAATRSDLLLAEQRLVTREAALRQRQAEVTGFAAGMLFRRRLRNSLQPLRSERNGLARRLQGQIKRKRAVERALGRREFLLRGYRLWHLVHVPIGVTLFTSVAIHIAAAIFFRAGVFQ